MKINRLLIGALALLLTGCANNEPDGMQEQVQYEPGNGFMSFNLTTPRSLTRASESDEATTSPDNDPQNGIYENGTPAENRVNSVRFYFFDKNGVAFPVRKHLFEEIYDSYIDWYPSQADIGAGNPDLTVESSLKAVVQLNLRIDSEGQWQYPTQVVAVMNPTRAISELGVETANPDGTIGPDLDALTSNLSPADYITGLTANNFVMSNSVFANNPGESNATVAITAAINPDNIKTTPEEARNKPVTIFVERVLARVDFGISSTFPNNETKELKDAAGNVTYIYKIGEYKVFKTVTTQGDDGQEITSTDVLSTENLYVKFLGWNVTQVASKSNLIKTINPFWTNVQIMGNPAYPWSTSDYHRSFWAFNPEAAGEQTFYQYGTFDKEKNPTDGSETRDNLYPANGNSIPAPGSFASPIYIQENANPYANNQVAAQPQFPTNLIVAAQIVDEYGNPYEVTEWMGQKYTKTALLNQLVATLMTVQPTQNGLYSYSGTPGNFTFSPISMADLEIISQDPATNTSDIDEPDYFSYITLSSVGKSKNWCVGTAVDEDNNIANPLTQEQVINSIREKVGHVLVWGSGYSYYAADILHLAMEPNNGDEEVAGYIGIVRNHIYRITVNQVTGFGTPVFDPSEIITPEDKTDTEAMLSAEIKILQWRVVTQDYTLTW